MISLFELLNYKISIINNNHYQTKIRIMKAYPRNIKSNINIVMIGLLLTTLFIAIQSTLRPQLNVMMQKNFVNAQISNVLGPKIEKQIDKFEVPPIPFNGTFEGVHVTLLLDNLNKKIGINWNASVLDVIDQYNWKIRSQNVNLTMQSNIQFKIGLAPKQKGQLNITVSKMIVNTALRFESAKARPSIGFDLQISDVVVAADQIDIKIEHKTIDNLIIRLLESLLKSRIPGIIKKAVINQLDPYISKQTANAISQKTPPVGPDNTVYVVSLNTTEVPYFNIQNKEELVMKIDLTLQNQDTNATNPEIQQEILLEQHSYSSKANATIAMSSNMINTILWLIEDSKLLQLTVTQKTLGPNPPINLTTKDLAILIPDLNKNWPNRDIVLTIQPSSKFDDLFVRSGRIISAISLAVDFVVNLTDTTSKTVEQCLQNMQCVKACTLNISIPISASMKMTQQANFVQALIQSAKIYQISVIEPSLVNVNVNSLKTILNSIVGSMIAQQNNDLIEGINLKLPKNLTDLNITGIFAGLHKDYVDIGILSSLKSLDQSNFE